MAASERATTEGLEPGTVLLEELIGTSGVVRVVVAPEGADLPFHVEFGGQLRGAFLLVQDAFDWTRRTGEECRARLRLVAEDGP